MACPLSERGREYSYETGGTSDVKTYGLRSDAGYMNLEDATVSMMYMDRTGMELYKVK